MNETFYNLLEDESLKQERKYIHQDLTELLSQSIDLQDFHSKMATYFNEGEK